MRDPQRLASGDDELAKLLASAEGDVLDDEAVDRVRRGLEVAGVLAAGGLVAAPAVGGLKGLFAATSTKVAAALLLGAALAAAGYQLTRGPGAQVPQPVVDAPRDVAPPAATAAVVPSNLAPLAADAPAPSASGVAAQGVVSPVLKATPRVAPPPPAASAPLAARASTRAPSPRDGLLLLQARRSLATDPQHALDLVREHAREFPDSQLAPERAELRRAATAAGAK